MINVDASRPDVTVAFKELPQHQEKQAFPQIDGTEVQKAGGSMRK